MMLFIPLKGELGELRCTQRMCNKIYERAYIDNFHMGIGLRITPLTPILEERPKITNSPIETPFITPLTPQWTGHRSIQALIRMWDFGSRSGTVVPYPNHLQPARSYRFCVGIPILSVSTLLDI